ncbi:MAG: rhodanese-like domain-containing protein [Burkholderiales bacterium]
MHRHGLAPFFVALALHAGLALGTTQAHAQACSIAGATIVEPDAKTGEVSTQEIRQILQDGSAVVIDTRTPSEFAAGHIPGSRNLEVGGAAQVDAVARLTAGDKSKALVLYCNGPYCQASRRLGEQLVKAGFTNVRRYQLGMPVWRALGGPTEITLMGLGRVYGRDQTAVFVDARSPEEFAKGSLTGARNLPADLFVAGSIKQPPFPEDDFNTRIVLFGRDANQARALAQALATRPWHNVSYVAATFEEVQAAGR